MKHPIAFTVLILTTLALALASRHALRDKAVDLLYMKVGGETGMETEAYHLTLYLGGRESSAEILRLDSGHRKRALQAVAKRDKKLLSELARELGQYRFVSAARGLKEGWPWYLGGESFQDDVVSTLGFPDKWYLSLASKAPPPPSYDEDGATASVPTPAATEGPAVELHPEDWVESHPLSHAATPSSTTGASDQAAVKVEILNDCGIKGAADDLARELKRPGIDIVFVGNTSRFRHRKTCVQSSVGIPVALQEILELTGIDPADVEEVQSGRRKADVTVIVGRDYRKILERMRDRATD